MIPRACALALIGAVLGALLEGMGFRSKKLFITLVAILAMVMAAESLGDLLGSLGTLADRAGVSELAEKALRAVGLGYVFGFTSEICRSLGESGLASLVLTVGRLEIFLIAMPYFVKTLEMGLELLS